jgi:hypothetical protein
VKAGRIDPQRKKSRRRYDLLFLHPIAERPNFCSFLINIDIYDLVYGNINDESIMSYRKGTMQRIRSVGRICGWIAFALLILTLLTGYGITDFRIVTPLTFGILNKAAAQRLHSYTEVPLVVLLAVHVGIAVWARRSAARNKEG